jgi:hypothetical protein
MFRKRRCSLTVRRCASALRLLINSQTPCLARATASFFAAVPKATSANAAVDACGIPDGFCDAGAIISVSCLERPQGRSAQA